MVSSVGFVKDWTRYIGVDLSNRESNTGTEPLVVVAGMFKDFGGLVALDEVSFALGTGEIVGLIGPNGTGKTTTMWILKGMETVFKGRVTIAGLAQPKRRDAGTDSGRLRLPPRIPARQPLTQDSHHPWYRSGEDVTAPSGRVTFSRIKSQS